MWGVVHFKEDLFGQSFEIHSDHQPLKWLKSTAKLKGKFARWALTLQKYDFEIVHRPRTANANADGCGICPLPWGEGDDEVRSTGVQELQGSDGVRICEQVKNVA